MKKYLHQLKATSTVILISLLLLHCKKEEVPVPDSGLNQLIDKINLLRQSGCNCGADYMPPVQTLTSNRALQTAALAHANDMAQKNYFDHVSPGGSSPNERALAAGYNGTFISENLAKGYGNADQVITAWKNSVSHCKAMMDAQIKEAGAGEAQNYWAISFGTP